DAAGNPALGDFRFGNSLIISLVDDNRNQDATVTESVYVALYNWTNGDREGLYLNETGPNTGEFRSVPGFTTNVTVTEGVYYQNVFANDLIFTGDGASEIKDAIQIVYQDPAHALDEYVISINAPSQKISVASIQYPNKDITTAPGRMSFTITNTGDKPLSLE